MLRFDLGITEIDDLFCWGYKRGRMGLGLVKCSGKVVGVFTKNKFKAAPVKVTMEHIKNGYTEGIIVNSGNANAFTGKAGIENAKKMVEIYAKKLGVDEHKIMVASTGIIGVQLDMDWIRKTFTKVYKKLCNTREAALRFAKAITTTDSFTKEVVLKKDYTIAGVAKGAGMICPNMATMLSFLFTDAKLNLQEMQDALKTAVDNSFNLLTVDNETSTNDMVLLVSTGKRSVNVNEFAEDLTKICLELAKMIARDGEGATKLLEVEVKGAKSKNDAFKAAKRIASSLLVKTAVFGCSPNWGRIIAALGSCDVDVDEDVSISIAGAKKVKLVERGKALGNERIARKVMKASKELKIIINLHKGNFSGYAIGCDLGYKYVKINSEYN